MEMIALTRNGDTKHAWNTADPDECAQAETIFNEYRSNGFSAFKVEDNVNTSITEFDPDLGTVMFIPAMAGG